MALLTTVYSDSEHFNTSGSLAYSNGSVCYRSGDYINYTAAVRIMSIPWNSASMATGVIYWGTSAGATTYPIADVTNGSVKFRSTTEQIDYTGSNRTIYLTFKSTAPTTHTVKLHSNGGSWYGGQTVLSYTVNDGGDFSFSGHDPTTPPSAAKRIAGWGVSASSTSIAYSTTATLSNVKRDYDFYAVWGSKIAVTFDANDGLLPNGRETRVDEYWQGSTIHFSDADYLATRDGFTLSGWKNGDVLYPVTGTFDISLAASALTFVAEWKPTITKFYWHGSDTADNSYFQTGKLIADAITAEAWNSLQDKVYDLFHACGAAGSYTKQTAQPSGTIYAFQYNATVSALQAIKNKLGGSMRIPATVVSGTTVIIPAQWNGENTSWFSPTASLKSAINHLIDTWG